MTVDSTLAALLDRVRSRDRGALARAFSLLERDPDRWPLRDTATGGKGFVVAVTGPPGAGKSTLVGRVAEACSRGDMSCGVIAFDPASPLTGGALLGDRIRMLDAAHHPNVFVRSVAARDPGGAGTTALPALLALFELYGFDLVLLETVGAGQEATPLLAMADAVVLVLAPGLGDGVQLLKAGALELADVLVVNKADRPGAEELVREVSAYFRLVSAPSAATPTIVRTVATEGTGIAELVDALLTLRDRLADAGILQERRRSREIRFLEARVRGRCLSILQELVLQIAAADSGTSNPLSKERAIYRELARRLASYAATELADPDRR